MILKINIFVLFVSSWLHFYSLDDIKNKQLRVLRAFVVKFLNKHLRALRVFVVKFLFMR